RPITAKCSMSVRCAVLIERLFKYPWTHPSSRTFFFCSHRAWYYIVRLQGSRPSRRSLIMDFANDWLAIFLLIALFAIVLVYVFWPSNKKRFDRAAKSILRDEDKPRH